MDKLKLWHFFDMMFYALLAVGSLLILYLFNRLPTTISILDFIVLSLATFRLIELFVADNITDFVRDYFDNLESDFGKSMSQLVHCPWCVGIWMALFVGFFYFLTPFSWYLIFIVALAGLGTFLKILVNKLK